MCGRYNFTVEQNDEMLEVIEKLNARFYHKEPRMGEVFPTNLVPILVEEDKRVYPILSNWGFPQFNKKGVIINARVETVLEKPTFRDSALNRRCIVPSTGFYEWNEEKQKFLFLQADKSSLYMAGIYNQYDGESRFTILTTEANNSMIDVHTRMPVIVEKEEIPRWIKNQFSMEEILNRVPAQLVRRAV